MAKRDVLIFLAICSLLSAVGLTLSILFAFMAFGYGWVEPNPIIAIVEFMASIGLIILGLIGWGILIKRGGFNG